MINSPFTFSKVIAAVLTDSGYVAEALESYSVSFASPAMQPGAIYYIKCSIVFHNPAGWMFLGVTQLSEPRKDAEVEASSHGWSTASQYCAGKHAVTSFPGWQTGDEVIFKVDLSADMLSVRSSQQSSVFHLGLSDVVHAPFSFHFGGAKGSKVRLLAADMQDRLHFS